MKLVRIEGYAQAYHSEAEWNEEIYLTEETYKLIKHLIEDLEIYIFELDGKHSEVKADIDISVIEEDEFDRYSWDEQYSGYNIVETLQELINTGKLNIDLDVERKKADEIVKSIDGTKTISVTVKKSEIKELMDFVEKLKER